MKDSELIQKVHSGNKEAVGIIIERYYADIRDFINGNKRKEFIFIWHECHLIINKLWSNRFDSESTFCNNSLDMGSSFSCVGTFICNTDKKIV